MGKNSGEFCIEFPISRDLNEVSDIRLLQRAIQMAARAEQAGEPGIVLCQVYTDHETEFGRIDGRFVNGEAARKIVAITAEISK